MLHKLIINNGIDINFSSLCCFTILYEIVIILYFFTFSTLLLYELSNIVTWLNFRKVFHVRSVTQGDVIRADAKDIPRIFQVIRS